MLKISWVAVSTMCYCLTTRFVCNSRIEPLAPDYCFFAREWELLYQNINPNKILSFKVISKLARPSSLSCLYGIGCSLIWMWFWFLFKFWASLCLVVWLKYLILINILGTRRRVGLSCIPHHLAMTCCEAQNFH